MSERSRAGTAPGRSNRSSGNGSTTAGTPSLLSFPAAVAATGRTVPTATASTANHIAPSFAFDHENLLFFLSMITDSGIVTPPPFYTKFLITRIQAIVDLALRSTPEDQVKGRNDDKGVKGGGDTTAQDDDRRRPHDFA